MMKEYTQLIRHSGNNPLFDMMDISVLGTLTGSPIHIHAEGLRGTGKTTVIRAYKEVLPQIKRIKGCLYNCDPMKPHCPEHRGMSLDEIEKVGIEMIDMPFLEISPSAKKGTVVGSIDLTKLTAHTNPEAALLLGTIPKAHRGIIFIDEINRIADISPEIADVFLDVMGTKPGRIQIEEVGLPVVEIPVQVSVWAASNPDEDPGPLEDIRRQLSDRFDFSVNVERPNDLRAIKRILEGQNIVFHNLNPEKKILQFLDSREVVNRYLPSSEIRDLLADLYVEFGIESLRGIESALMGLQLRSALFKRNSDYDDMIFIAKYALKHRVDGKSLSSILNHIEQRKNRAVSQNTSVCAGNKLESASEGNKKIKETSNKKPQSPFNSLVNFLYRLMGGINQEKSLKKSSEVSGTDPKDVDIKAPPQKALAMKELDINEYVKTEEELH